MPSKKKAGRESGPAKQLFANPQTPELAGFIGAVH